jgi:hypothetical protein
MAVRIQLRRDTAANWTSNNPVLRQGEIGIETDTYQMKVGNGTSTWTQITQYMNIVPDGNLTIEDYIPASDIGAESGVVGLSSYNAIIPGSSIILEGTTANAHETTLTVTDPTEDRTITFPNATGTVALAENVAALSGATFTGNISVPTQITFEGATADAYETIIAVTDPTADRTITIPDATGTLALAENVAALSGATFTGNISVPTQITFEGTTANDFETIISVTDPTSDRVIVFPDLTGTVVTTGDTGSVTNLMLAGSIANDKLAGSIANDKLSNSAITINGTSTSLGGSRTLGTDDVSEGSTNKYFTDDRAQDAIATAIAAGTHTNITITYDDDNNKFTFVGANTYSDENAQDAVGNAVGTGLSYNDTTGAISVTTNTYDAYGSASTVAGNLSTHESDTTTHGTTGNIVGTSDTQTLTNKTLTSPKINEDVVLTSTATELNYVDGVTSAIQTQIDSKASLSGATFTGAVSGTSLTLSGDLTINGTTTTLNSTTLSVDDKNIELGSVATPSDATADGGGITLKGTTDKTFNWVDATDAWTSSEHVNLASGKSLYLNGTLLKDATETLTNKTLTSPVINTPTGITKSDVGLANVDNTTDAGKPISTATQTALDLKLASATAATTYAPLASPTFTGTVTLPTGAVTSSMILDGTILDADINASAAIALSKLATDPLARANHTGSQAASTISDFNEAAQDAVGNAVGTGLTYTDSTGAISVTTNTYDAYGSASTVAGNLSTHESDTTTHGTTGNIVGTSDTQTLTNKTLTSPKINEDVVVTATATELNYVDGVTSAIQTQLDGKVDESLFDTKGDILVASADNTPAKLAAGTNGYLLTANSSATNGIEWAAAPVSLPAQSAGTTGYYLTSDGTSASWGALVVPIETGTATVSANTATTVDTTALSAFTSIEYMVSLKQGSKIRTSKVVVQTDGTSVDMTEFAITETGGTIAGVVVSAAVSSTNGVLQLTVTDASSTNVTVKFSKVKL